MHTQALWRLLLWLAVLITGVQCGDKADPITGPGNGGAEVTYTDDIQPILAQNCTRCHSTTVSGPARNGAPTDVNFNTYALAAASASRANPRVQAGTMPPTGGIPQNQRALFQAWVQSGLAE